MGLGEPLSLALGGGPSPQEEIYDAMFQNVGDGIQAPEDSLVEKWRMARARGLAAVVQDERAAAQSFPDLSTDFIPVWEDILGIPPDPTASESDRQATILEAYTRLISASFPDLTSLLNDIDPLMNILLTPHDLVRTTVPGRAFEDWTPSFSGVITAVSDVTASAFANGSVISVQDNGNSQPRFTTIAAHGMVTGDFVKHINFTIDAYNVTAEVTVISATEYDITSLSTVTFSTGFFLVNKSVAAVNDNGNGIARFTTAQPHGMFTGQTVEHAGFSQAAYNVTARIVVISDAEYDITSVPFSTNVPGNFVYQSIQIAQTPNGGEALVSGQDVQIIDTADYDGSTTAYNVSPSSFQIDGEFLVTNTGKWRNVTRASGPRFRLGAGPAGAKNTAWPNFSDEFAINVLFDIAAGTLSVDNQRKFLDAQTALNESLPAWVDLRLFTNCGFILDEDLLDVTAMCDGIVI